MTNNHPPSPQISTQDVDFLGPKTPDGTPLEVVAMTTLSKWAGLEVGETITFHVEAGTGEAYVQRLRTELSRLRHKMRMRKQIPRKLKMLVVSIEANGTHDTVSLQKAITGRTELTEEIQRIMTKLEKN